MLKLNIKPLLALRDMTEEDLAARAALAPSTVKALCAGTVKRLSVASLDRLCEVLDCQPADILKRG